MVYQVRIMHNRKLKIKMCSLDHAWSVHLNNLVPALLFQKQNNSYNEVLFLIRNTFHFNHFSLIYNVFAAYACVATGFFYYCFYAAFFLLLLSSNLHLNIQSISSNAYLDQPRVFYYQVSSYSPYIFLSILLHAPLVVKLFLFLLLILCISLFLLVTLA